MANRFKTKFWRVGIVLFAVIIVGGCAAPTEAPSPLPEEEKPPPVTGEIKRIVEVEATEQTLHYQRQSFWTAERFSELSANKDEFEADFMSSFDSNLAEYNLYAQNYEISFDEPNGSTKVTCHIYNGISKKGDKYTARFEKWLSLPVGFDLLDFHKISPDTLYGETEVEGMPVTVTLRFPVPITGNCHWHVWYPMPR